MITKITTADCKKMLIQEISKYPSIISEIFQDTFTAVAEAMNPKK
jgi:hypothetical protein